MRSMDSEIASVTLRRRSHARTSAEPTVYPLLAHASPTSIIAWQGNRAHSVQEFLRSVWAPSRQLPAQRYAINVCKDRYHFAVGFAAALVARQTNLLPPCRAEESLHQLAHCYSDAYVLTDHDQLDTSLPQFRLGDWGWSASGSTENPIIPAEQIAAIAFTSGSSGFPLAHAKSWGSLVMGAKALGRQFDLASYPPRTVVGTVPAQHMYGLETTVMLPFQWGWSLHGGNSILPADIRTDLERLGSPAWLMTTPFHLNAYLCEQTLYPASRALFPPPCRWPARLRRMRKTSGICRSMKSTAAQKAACSPRDIRRMVDLWTLCHELRMKQEGDSTWVMGGHVGGWLKLTDRIHLRNRREFLLLGPNYDLVKVPENEPPWRRSTRP